jgi:hypothetical protein
LSYQKIVIGTYGNYWKWMEFNLKEVVKKGAVDETLGR